jgi:hypothetical protein
MGRMISSSSMIWVDVTGAEHQRCPICRKYLPAGRPYKDHAADCRRRYLQKLGMAAATIDSEVLDDAYLGL